MRWELAVQLGCADDFATDSPVNDDDLKHWTPESRMKPAPSSDELKDTAPAKKSTKAKEPAERKPKKKKTKKLVEDSTDGEDVFMDAVEEQVPSRPASCLMTAKAASRKVVEQQQLASRKAPLSDDAPIMLSSDVEEEAPKPPPKPLSNVGKLASKFEFPKKASLSEKPKTPPRPPRSSARPLSPVRAPLSLPPQSPVAEPEPMDADADVDMEDYVPEEENALAEEIATQPVTPPRPGPSPPPPPIP